MRKTRVVAAAVLAVVFIGFIGARPASADADKEHKLIMAEIRMMQEEQQQLRAVLLGLGDTLKALNVRLDADAGRLQKSLADQKLIVEGVAETTRILREKADETNVRLSSMTQELQALRQTVASMPPPVPSMGLVPTGEPPRATRRPRHRARRLPQPPPRRQTFPRHRCGIRCTRSTRRAVRLAVEGFQSFIRTFPTSPRPTSAAVHRRFASAPANTLRR